MPGSYKKIDYRLRPAKSIERKMMAETFRCLSPFARVDSYRYVGFGSLGFVDFSVFHKLLGFNEMISIEDEDDPDVQDRFEFNRPFDSVSVQFGASRTILPGLSWDPRSIYWLDYDSYLHSDILDDIGLIAFKATSGSVLVVSVCASLSTYGLGDSDEEGAVSEKVIQKLKRKIGADKIPVALKAADLKDWGMATVFRTIIQNKIDEGLKQRNGGLGRNQKVTYRQLFNFHYADGMKILTVGGIFFEEAQELTYDRCGFQYLDFISADETPYLIDPPLLTLREMRAIERFLPDKHFESGVPLSESEIERFQKVYRYFPTFAEAEL